MIANILSLTLAAQAVLAFAPVNDGHNKAAYGGPLVYGGGRLLPNAKIYPVYVGNARDQAKTNAFYASIGGSTHYSMLTEYNTNGYQFGPSQFVKSFTGSVSGGTDPAAVVKTLLASGVVGPIPADAYFPVHYGPEYDATVASSCSSYCAYHASFTYNGQKVAYAMMPDCSATTCHNGYPGPTQFDSMTCIAAHELLEAVTDPDPTSGWNGNGEIGDICYGQCGGVVGGDGATINVQYEYSNREKKCILNPSGVVTKTTTTTTTTTKAATTTTTTTTTKAGTTTTTTTTKPVTKTTTKAATTTTTGSSGGGPVVGGACTQGVSQCSAGTMYYCQGSKWIVWYVGC